MKRSRFHIFLLMLILSFPISFYGQDKQRDSLLRLSAQSLGEDKLLHLSKYARLIVAEMPDSASNLAKFILERVSIENIGVVANARLVLGDYAYYKHQYSESLSEYGKALDNYLMLKDSSGVAETSDLQGRVYVATKHYDRAIEAYRRAMRINHVHENMADLAAGYTNVGKVLYLLGDTTGLFENCGEAMRLYEKLGMRAKIAEVSCIQADAYVEGNQLELAESYYLVALSDFWALDDQPNVASVLYKLSELFYKEDDEKAMLFADKAVVAFSDLNDGENLGKVYYLKGLINEKDKNFREAVQEFLRCEQNLRELKYSDIRLKNLQALCRLYEIVGGDKSALQVSSLIIHLKDSLYLADMNERDREVAHLKNNFKAEKAQILQRNADLKFLIFLFAVSVIVLFSVGVLIYLLVRKNYKEHQRLIALDQTVLRSNMTPGLLFNSLSSIQYFILENKQSTAIEYLGDYSKLMRLVLKYSQDEFTTLENEKEVLELYLSLQSLRFDNRLKYIIHIDESLELSSTLIPPLLGHPFIEQIVDGLSTVEGKDGILWLSFSKVNNMIVYRIHDRNLGPITNPNLSASDWGQLKVAQDANERIRLINHGSDAVNHIRMNIEMVENGNNSGVMIEFILPVLRLINSGYSVKDQLKANITL